MKKGRNGHFNAKLGTALILMNLTLFYNVIAGGLFSIFTPPDLLGSWQSVRNKVENIHN